MEIDGTPCTCHVCKHAHSQLVEFCSGSYDVFCRTCNDHVCTDLDYEEATDAQLDHERDIHGVSTLFDQKSTT